MQKEVFFSPLSVVRKHFYNIADIRKSSCCTTDGVTCMHLSCDSAGHAGSGGRPGQAGHQLAELREREAGHAGDVVGRTRGRLGGRTKRVSAVRDGTERAVG